MFGGKLGTERSAGPRARTIPLAGGPARITYAPRLEAISTEDLRIALFFTARAERHGGTYAEDSPREDAIVGELVRRNGTDWLDAQVASLRERVRG